MKFAVLTSLAVLTACSQSSRPVVSVDPRSGEVTALVDGTELKGRINEDGAASLQPSGGANADMVAEHVCLDGEECKRWVLNVYNRDLGPEPVVQAVAPGMEIPPSEDPMITGQSYVGLPLSADNAVRLGLNPLDEKDQADREARLGPWLDLTGGGISSGAPNTYKKKNPDGTVTEIFGSLANDSEMPVRGSGFRSIDRDDAFASGHFASLLQNAAAEYSRTVDPGAEIVIGGISKRGGGFNPGHKSHQNGMDADIPFMGNKGYVNVIGPDGKVGPKFNPEKNWAFFRLVYGQQILDGGKPKSVVSMILVGPRVKDFLCIWAKENGILNNPTDVEIMRRVAPTEGHDDHIHLRVHCSPHHPACIKQGYVPQTTGCA